MFVMLCINEKYPFQTEHMAESSTAFTEQKLQQSAWLHRTDLCVLRLEGADSIDFLQRVSTNDVRDVAGNVMRTTLLCTDKGRILDVVRVVSHETHVLLVVSAARREQVQRYLQTYIIMDDVRVRDCSASWECYEICGSDAAAACSEVLAGGSPSAAEHMVQPFPANAVYRGIRDDDQLIAFSIEPRNEQSYVVLVQIADSQERSAASASETLFAHIPYIDDSAANVLRIEQGIPAVDKELTIDHNPLEANLLHYINFRKGCYIGQEVIARLDSYNKVKVRLVGLRCATSIDEGSAVILPDAEPGVVTSSCESPRFGQIALAYIRTEYAIAGHSVIVRDAHSGSEHICTVHTLPFHL
jgi:folate-binding protein YgfZ